MDYLSEKEIMEVEKFCNNVVAFNAVEKIMLEGIYLSGTLNKEAEAEPQKNWALSLGSKNLQTPLSDAQMGAELRAMTEGIWFVKSGMDKLKQYKKPVEKVAKKAENKAL